jgi:hypothetical protein
MDSPLEGQGFEPSVPLGTGNPGKVERGHLDKIARTTASGARCPMQLQANYAGSCP